MQSNHRSKICNNCNQRKVQNSDTTCVDCKVDKIIQEAIERVKSRRGT